MKKVCLLLVVVMMVGCATAQKTKMVGAGLLGGGVSTLSVITAYSLPQMDNDQVAKQWAIGAGISAGVILLGSILFMDSNGDEDTTPSDQERMLRSHQSWMQRISDQTEKHEDQIRTHLKYIKILNLRMKKGTATNETKPQP